MKDYRTWWRKILDSTDPIYKSINKAENTLSKVTGSSCFCSACNFEEDQIKYGGTEWDCMLEQLWAIREGLA